MKKRTIHRLSQLPLTKKMAYCKELNSLIEAGSTGNNEDLSVKMNISQALLLELIKYMTEEMGCPIEYSDSNLSYFYTRKGKFFVGFIPEN